MAIKPMTEGPDPRYARHRALHEISSNDARIHASTVCVVGAGGVASSCLLYLAAAGVRKLIIVDNDKVDVTNLQRQVIHSEERVGINKAESAETVLRALNSNVKIIVRKEKFTRETAPKILEGRVDCIVDTTDVPEARFLVAEIAYRKSIPLVHAAAVRFTVTLTTVIPWLKKYPCLRCLYRAIPSRELRQVSERDGIFGPAAGTAGTLAASECIKVCLYRDDKKLPDLVLCGRLMIIHCFEMASRTIPYTKKADCCLCCEIYDSRNDHKLLKSL